jgi:hypothetical protein
VNPFTWTITGLQVCAALRELSLQHWWGACFWLGCAIANVGVLGGMTK